jgi:hypothetical protein
MVDAVAFPPVPPAVPFGDRDVPATPLLPAAPEFVTVPAKDGAAVAIDSNAIGTIRDLRSTQAISNFKENLDMTSSLGIYFIEECMTRSRPKCNSRDGVR